MREPDCIGPLRSLYSECTRLVFSPLPFFGARNGPILQLFEPTSGWAEKAYFQLATPRGYWRGHISRSEGSSDKQSEEHKELPSSRLGADWLPGAPLWLVGTLPPWQGSTFNPWQVRVFPLNPRTCLPLERWDLGMGYDMELSVYYPVAPIPQAIS